MDVTLAHEGKGLVIVWLAER